MPKFEIKWNPDALYEIRSSPGVVGEIDSILARWCDAANAQGSGTYGWESHQGAKSPQGRWRGTVFPADFRARRDNARQNTLIRVMGGG